MFIVQNKAVNGGVWIEDKHTNPEMMVTDKIFEEIYKWRVSHLIFLVVTFSLSLSTGVLPPASQASWRGSHSEPSDTSAQGRKWNKHPFFSPDLRFLNAL